MKNKTGVYVRVSTEEQALHGYSISAQKEKLIFYAKDIKGWDIVKIYSDEGKSAKDIINRPQMLELIQDIKSKKINNVLVFKIDRLTRSTKDLIELIELFNKYDCSFNSLNESIDTTTATGRMFIKIIGIFAEFERENIVERVKMGFERKVKEGYSICSSTASFGYNKIIGKDILVINKKESVVVKKIYDMYLKNKSILEIVDYLNNNNIPTKKNKKWTYKTIKLILTNPTYIGKVRYGVEKRNGFCVSGYHKKIIDEDVFYTVQGIINSKNIIKDAYYSHILKCSCGCDMVVKRIYKTNKYNKRVVYINYRCSNKKEGCTKDISHLKMNKMMNSINKNWNDFDLDKKIAFLTNKKLVLKNNSLIVF